MNKTLLLPLLGCAMVAWLPLSVAREVVVLPGVVGKVGVTSGVDTQGPGTLVVGNQNINTSNDAGGAITTDAADTANIQFDNSSIVTGFVGSAGSTFLNISAGTNANTVTFNGPVYSTTFSVAGTGTVNFNGGFTSNSGSTMDFAGDGFINVAAGQTVKAAITNTAGAGTGTLTLNTNSTLDGAVGAASGLKQINVVVGNALITGQTNATSYTLGTNTLNVAGAFAIPVAGSINTTIYSESLYGKIVPVGAASIGDALQVNVTVTGPIPVGSKFNIVDATSGTNGSTVTATGNSTRYLFSAAPTTNGLVQIVTTQIPLADVVAPVGNPNAPIIAPAVDALPLAPATTPLLTAVTLLPNAQEVSDALAQLQPGATSLAAPQAAFRVTEQFQGLVNSHLAGAAWPCSQTDQSDDRNTAQREDSSTCQPAQKRSQLWGAAFGRAGRQDDHRGYEGYTDNSAGMMLAYVIPFGQATTAGIGVRYANTSLNGSTAMNHANIKSHQAMAYLGYAPGRSWFANASLVYGKDDYSVTRRIAFPGFNGYTGAHYSGHQYTADVATGYHLYLGDGRTTITPMATLQYTHLKADGYTEAGNSGIDLKVDARNYNFLQSGLGVKFARDISISNTSIIRPELHVNWLHSFRGNAMRNTAAFTAGGPAFTGTGVTSEKNLFTVGAGVMLAANTTWSLEGVYDYQWNGSYKAGQAMLKFTLHL